MNPHKETAGMASARTLYRTVVQFEILSEEKIPELDLKAIAYNTTEGDWPGRDIPIPVALIEDA
jgi:hypothetical protein